MVANITKGMDTQKHYQFFRHHYHQILWLLMGIIVLMIMLLGLVLYQVFHRPLPQFSALDTNGKRMMLTGFDEPNLLADTILRWASKAAITAYTFDFANYKIQLNAARPYFTATGWQAYLNSVNDLITYITANRIFVNSVVSGAPIISNQGNLPDKGYTWRVQIPFLVTYQTSSSVVKRSFIVVVTIVRVPTTINSQGIGIDSFVMYEVGSL